MQAQVVAFRWHRLFPDSRRRKVYKRGEIIDITAEEWDRFGGTFLREPSSEPLPPVSHFAADARPTTPAGKPLELASPASEASGEEWTPPKTKAEADEQAAAFGVTFNKSTKMADRVAALVELRAAKASSEDAAAEEMSDLDLETLSDDELVEAGYKVGLQPGDLEGLERDALIARVAAAIGMRSSSPSEQAKALEQE